MCLYTLDNAILTAKQDIRVLKVIRDDNISMYQRFSYRPNTLYRLRKALKIACGRVHHGFHAFIRHSGHPTYTYKYVEFTIPKGAKYVIGDNNDIVSTSIRSGSLEPMLVATGNSPINYTSFY